MTTTLDDVFAGLDQDPREDVTPTTDNPFRADGCFEDAQSAMAFMMAAMAGKAATVTFVSKATQARFTYKISRPQPRDGEQEDLGNGMRFVSVLNGPDNWSNYQYFGYIRRGVFFHGRAKAKVGENAPSVKAFDWAWRQLAQGNMPSSLEVWHEGKCGRCGRKLTVPSSIRSGFGPECEGKVF